MNKHDSILVLRLIREIAYIKLHTKDMKLFNILDEAHRQLQSAYLLRPVRRNKKK